MTLRQYSYLQVRNITVSSDTGRFELQPYSLGQDVETGRIIPEVR